MTARLLLLLAITSIAIDCYGAKKDFKGLFGSYRREKYTENEAHDTDFGLDLMLTTAFPGTTLVKTNAISVNPTTADNAMQSSAFFSGEIGVWMSLFYHFQVFADIGYYSYDARTQNGPNTACGATQTCFTQYSMSIVPAIAGVRYRFGRSDIVPYVGAGAGLAYVTRNGGYDYTPVGANISNQNINTVLVAQATLGLEFYISPHVGLRMEASAMYLNLPYFLYNPGGQANVYPLIEYEANPILVRYSSGLFMLF